MTGVRDYLPPHDEWTQGFWEGTRRRQFLLQWCLGCRRFVHHPRAACPRCLGQGLTWVEGPTEGSVYAFSVHHRAWPPMTQADLPYVVALVDLAPDVRMVTNLVDTPLDLLRVGMPVSLGWLPARDGYHLPVFAGVREAAT